MKPQSNLHGAARAHREVSSGGSFSTGSLSTTVRVMRALALSLVLAVGLAVKLCVLWAPAEDLLSLPGAAVALQRHGEEFSRGDIAVAISEGPLLPVIDYQWAPGFGGSLITGLLAVP
ncbi:MAG: hypothetical protein VCA36_05685, partial [Opitutales bacterium]